SGEVALTADEQSVDARNLGHTVSAHEECAVELAVQTAQATDGSVSVLALGSADSVEQLRDAVAVGCTDATLVECDADAFGPADVAAAIADVVTARAAEGTTYDLVLVGNDAADTGDFQVGVRLAYALDRPVLTGISTIEVTGDTVVAHGAGPTGTEVFELPMPALIAVQEGGVEPRYPSIPGRMKAKRAQIETVTPTHEPVGSARVRLKLPPAQPSSVQVLGHGPEAASALVDILTEIGVTAK
ncbi:MAG: electron transfer flavoprotein subunit beta/FixA family protein, partial [Nocardioidaceae bacterium]